MEPEEQERDALLKRIGQKRGFRFGLFEFLAEVDYEYLKHMNEWVEFAYLTDRHLGRKIKEFVIIAVLCTRLDDVNHIKGHIKAAVDTGATKEEILEAINLLAIWAGGPCRLRGLEAWRQYFDPSLPPIMQPVEVE
ncbi:MAG: carboxymuconolactone decarboxylase family protein [Chloroflexi bacterium]|nr:carboxymuconolactone decarboxylase family protein [Chloroflexota bacterium]